MSKQKVEVLLLAMGVIAIFAVVIFLLWLALRSPILPAG
jgi:hypothetical protein